MLSGYSATKYVYGTQQISITTLANWLGVPLGYTAVAGVLSSGGIPYDGIYNIMGITVDRVWVKLTIGSTSYYFDPAFKEHDVYPNFLTPESILGYSRSDFQSSALSGAVTGSDYVQSINETNIRSKLATYATNLADYFRTNYVSNDPKQIIGGNVIKETKTTQYPTTNISYYKSTYEEWSDMPAEKAAKIKITHYTGSSSSPTKQINEHLIYTHDLMGKRLTLTYANNQPQISLDDTVLITGSATTGANAYLVISIDHPYAAKEGQFADQSATYKIVTNGSYSIVYDFGGMSVRRLQRHQKQLDSYRAQGFSDSDKTVRGETLTIMGLTWVHELQLADKLLSSFGDTTTIKHHTVGLMAQESRYYIDLKNKVTSFVPVDWGGTGDMPHFKSQALLSSALEHGILEQMMETSGVSTIKLFQLANSSGGKIYRINSDNWSTASTNLHGYSSTYLNNLYSKVVAGDTLFLPDTGNLTLGSWSGGGYMAENLAGTEEDTKIEMAVGDANFNGGVCTETGLVDPYSILSNNFTNLGTTATPDSVGSQINIVGTNYSQEPVDMASGAYIYDHTDLVLGNTVPLGLSFARSYNSNQNYVKRNLGYGWSHNYDIYLTPLSHGETGLGMRRPLDAAPFIAGMYVIFDLLKNESSMSDRVIASLASKWAIDQLIDNAVAVQMGNKTMEYIKLTDGSYSSPPGITTKLVKNADNTYSLQERFGTKWDFDPYTTNGKTIYRIRKLTDVDGNFMDFTYTGDNLYQVKDAFNRTLTFGYTGDKLTSVSDSEGRSVSYSYTNEDLTTYTDPESKNWGYSYLSDHRMLSLINPLNETTVTNYYDSLGRVNYQVVPRQGGTQQTYSFYFSGYRNMEKDPAGRKIVYSYDEKGRNTGIEDQLGYETTKTYDGQDHITSITDARGYTTFYSYDENNNLKQVENAKQKITTYTYDPQTLALTDITDPLSHITHFEYDTEHHLTLTRNGVGDEIWRTYHPNGLLETLTDGNKTITTFTYDAYGSLETAKTGNRPTVNYDFDTIGRLSTLTNQASATSFFSFDKRNLPTLQRDPLNKDTILTYDAAGRVSTKKDRNNNTITYFYTPTGKIDHKLYPDNSTVNYGYSGFDELTSVQNASGTVSYTYHDNGTIASMTNANENANGFVFSYLYDENGNLTEITYPGGKKVTYRYDELNRVYEIDNNWLNQTATYTYDDANRLKEFKNFNGIITYYTYDDANRLYTQSSTVASYQIVKRDYNGNITEMAKSEPLATIMTTSSVSYTYNTATNRIQSAGTTTFTFDDEGQLKTVGATQAAFDYEHRLTGLGTSQYVYDGLGNRIQAARSGTVTKYAYDPAGNMLVVADGSNNISKFFIYGPNGLIAMVTNADQKAYCYHFDPSGNTVAITDQSQAVQNKYTYSQFGLVASQVEAVPQPFKFAGQYGVVAEPNNYYYMKARYYDANIGRFVSEDPIGFEGGDLNLYAYVGNNPINFVDPSGLCAECQQGWSSTTQDGTSTGNLQDPGSVTEGWTQLLIPT